MLKKIGTLFYAAFLGILYAAMPVYTTAVTSNTTETLIEITHPILSTLPKNCRLMELTHLEYTDIIHGLQSFLMKRGTPNDFVAERFASLRNGYVYLNETEIRKLLNHPHKDPVPSRIESYFFLCKDYGLERVLQSNVYIINPHVDSRTMGLALRLNSAYTILDTVLIKDNTVVTVTESFRDDPYTEVKENEIFIHLSERKYDRSIINSLKDRGYKPYLEIVEK